MNELIHHSIRRWAEGTPNAIAFKCRDRKIEYQELLRRTNQLANRLKALGLKLGDRVGILSAKDIELPISTYGVLAAGGAYVPIDPKAPIERVKFILTNCGIRILVTEESKIPLLQKIVDSKETPLEYAIGIPEGCIQSLSTFNWDSLTSESETPPDLRIIEDDSAYVMYTSGSTGVPKGLLHTHRSGLAYAKHSARLYQVGPRDILGNHAPLHFDISTFEFLTGPFAGTQSVLIPEEEIIFPMSLAHLIERERLTFWYSVPLALIQLLNRAQLDQFDLSSIRWILFGGEPFPPQYMTLLRNAFPNAELSNVYGPAEVNQCSHFVVPQNYSPDDGPIPLGSIWDGAKGVILDGNDCPLQGEARGELAISSLTMMKEYWARPDLEAKAYFLDFDGEGKQTKYYRTGDCVRRDADGALHFIGRNDRQIKIRGYRVELDEIESVLEASAMVEEAAVFLVEFSEGERDITAAVSLKPNAVFDRDLLISNLRSQLPAYSIPSHIELVDTFPRTPTGKVDRNQLTRRTYARI